MITDYHWIDDNSQLEQLISLEKKAALAFDSEFERVNTYYPNPALFQFQIGEEFYLLDMKKLQPSEGLQNILDNIIVHSGSEDLEIIQNMFNRQPKNVFDTQIAASLCGYGLHVSYQNLVKDLLDVDLPKEHSRSDWMRRPLSPNQIKYAIGDVAHLAEMKNILSQKLETLGRMEWFELVSKNKMHSTDAKEVIEKLFIKISKSDRLNISQKKLLFAILQWREDFAQQRNKPRNWIMKNDQIRKIIKLRPGNNTELIKKAGLYEKFVEYNGNDLIALYDSSQKIHAKSLPDIFRLDLNQTQIFAASKQMMIEKCEELDIPPSLVINTQDLKTHIARGNTLNDIELWGLING
ncbi:MAG: HRDC domain-containing protein [Gammaproteobacteria bacterium]|nr:HRDC domain-containing protein [Xanthomonadales bacterium]